MLGVTPPHPWQIRGLTSLKTSELARIGDLQAERLGWLDIAVYSDSDNDFPQKQPIKDASFDTSATYTPELVNRQKDTRRSHASTYVTTEGNEPVSTTELDTNAICSNSMQRHLAMRSMCLEALEASHTLEDVHQHQYPNGEVYNQVPHAIMPASRTRLRCTRP
ncbi:hypothetical protein NHQ30_011523 [Ciborinia camelliae]|nr:hypothetical protein NHQ30_011523 [Ciborinia camelliae]